MEHILTRTTVRKRSPNRREGDSSGMYAAIGAGISAIGGLAGNAMSGNSAMQGSKSAQDAAVRMWAAQNIYNHPKAQIARLKDAGLNPALLYGNGSTSTGQASMPEIIKRAPTDYSSGMQNAGNSMQNFLNLKSTEIANSAALKNMNLIDEEIRNKQADTLLKGSSTVLNQSNTARTDSERKRLDATFDYYVDAQQELARGVALDNERKFKENSNISARQAAELADIAQRIAESKKRMSNSDYDNKIKQFEIKLNESGLTKSDPLYSRLLKQASDKGYSIPTPRQFKDNVNGGVKALWRKYKSTQTYNRGSSGGW